jgi:hypothetical protein
MEDEDNGLATWMRYCKSPIASSHSKKAGEERVPRQSLGLQTLKNIPEQLVRDYTYM